MATLPMLAGIVSTVIFACSALPMLVKAWRTQDLASYSLGNMVLANVGNLVHSVYVFSLPPGPIWALHTFYLVTTALMLVWFLRYGLHQPTHAVRVMLRVLPDTVRRSGLLAWRRPSHSKQEVWS
jgi:uncharacterized protein with PQ loop repeat